MQFSVIIPVYNAVKYLEPCLDSVLAQEGEASYEVILVDDGSTDTSGAICDRYAARYENFRVLHTENYGLPSARNHGLEHAEGEYVLFLDADDLWKPELLSTVAALVTARPDMVLFQTERFQDDLVTAGTAVTTLPSGQSGGEYLSACLAAGTVPPPYAWVYAYSRAFLEANGLRFVDGLASSEDFEFNMRAIPLAGRIVGTSAVLHRYRQVPTSLSHTLSPRKLLANLETKAEAFRRHPSATLADLYTDNAVLLARLPRRDAGDCLAVLRANRDIPGHCAQPPLRLAHRLFSLFGFYGGARVYVMLRRGRRTLQGRR